MCGLAGIAGLEDMGVSAAKVGAMMRRIAHRGPDAEGLFVDDGIALGHRRLAIIDLSEAANQPMFDRSQRYAIILNGEIYNYRDVKKELPDYPFTTESDTEVVLASYIKFGPKCLSLLNGMFAFAIWDNQEKSLFFARDRLGVKPFYYALPGDGSFVFASEIRAILASGSVPKNIDRHGLFDYLMYQSAYAPRTIVEGISQLPAGAFGLYSRRSGLRVEDYWNIEKSGDEPFTDDPGEARKKIRDLLLSSVELRMISDVRLGAFLSGGIDSSAVVGLMSEVSEQPVDTFSVTFSEPEFDESEHSALIAKRFNTRHTSVELSPAAFLDELPRALSRMDSPSGDGINVYIVSKETRKAGITVALSGLGGDELFAGYPTFMLWSKIQSGLWPKLPKIVRESAGSVVSLSGRSKHQRLGELLAAPTLSLSDIYPVFRQVLSQQTVTALCGGNGHKPGIKTALDERAVDTGKLPLLSQFSVAEILGYTQNVLLKDTDQFSMASALEVREPFFDYRLVEYVLRIPDVIKHPKYPKSLLVESLAPMLPDSIVHRKKMGFVLPWEKWMRTELRQFSADRIAALSQRGILQAESLDKLWNSFLDGTGGVLWSHLWHLVVLEDWLQTNEF